MGNNHWGLETGFQSSDGTGTQFGVRRAGELWEEGGEGGARCQQLLKLKPTLTPDRPRVRHTQETSPWSPLPTTTHTLREMYTHTHSLSLSPSRWWTCSSSPTSRLLSPVSLFLYQCTQGDNSGLSVPPVSSDPPPSDTHTHSRPLKNTSFPLRYIT